ncbi:MAG: radical SAM protein, partial [Rhodospirillales bacterium]|nr:radical SAM protein [Rhodospirillales bacterium]
MIPSPTPPSRSRPFQVMVKPNGPRCNLDCTYCYYLEKERLYPETRKFRMPDDVLEAYVRDYIATQAKAGAPEIWFSWQGGEPTLLGVEFFRRAVALQKKYRPAGAAVRNALQTNGTLLDEEWARFLKEHDFLVGLSIDGPRELHDRYRVDRAERPTFDKVMEAVALLRGHQVDFNALTVVHRQNARKPREVYRFLKSIGVEYMQFIPIVERTADG